VCFHTPGRRDKSFLRSLNLCSSNLCLSARVVPDPAQATVQLRSAREAMDLDTASLIFGHGVPASPTLRGAVRVRRRRCPLPALAAACSSRVRPGEDAEGVVVRCWVPTSRCRARLTLRSPPTRTRSPRALCLVGRHAAAERRPPENHIEPRRHCSHTSRCELDIFIQLE
jgi:hypothetical protein